MSDQIDLFGSVILGEEERLRMAILAGDVAALDAILADDLTFVDQRGAVLTKAMDLEAHRSGRLRVRELAFSETTIKALGPVAVVVTRADLSGSYAGQAFAGRFRYTRVWREEAGRWRIAAGHCSTVG